MHLPQMHASMSNARQTENSRNVAAQVAPDQKVLRAALQGAHPVQGVERLVGALVQRADLLDGAFKSCAQGAALLIMQGESVGGVGVGWSGVISGRRARQHPAPHPHTTADVSRQCTHLRI